MLVSNTSTLILLAKVGCLEQFLSISPTIEIPSQVQEEALFEAGTYDARLIHQLIMEGKIKVIVVKETEVDKIRSEFRLDRGEAAAYIMFNRKKHDALLTDDGELIKLCKLQQVPFICALAVVIRLYERKILSQNEATEKLAELRSIGRYSEKVYQSFKGAVQ